MEFGKIEYLINNKVNVSIYLVNGIQLRGLITEQDSIAILLDDGNGKQIIYKHGIATIVPKGDKK